MFFGAEGVDCLLAWLPQLQQLTHLSLQRLAQQASSADAYSALLSSPKLHTVYQRLDLEFASLPRGAWQGMFSRINERAADGAAGQQKMKNLCTLQLVVIHKPYAEHSSHS
jgi:hypothetical protein